MQEDNHNLKKIASREPNNCKYIQVTDPVTKKTIFGICKTPDEGTQYTFWTRPALNEWGLTIKSMSKSLKGKANSSDINWKCSWVYNEDKNIFYSTVASRTLLNCDKIENEEATNLKNIYDIYKNPL